MGTRITGVWFDEMRGLLGQDLRKPLIVTGRRHEADWLAHELHIDHWEYVYSWQSLAGYERPLVYRGGTWMWRDDYNEIEQYLRTRPGATLIDGVTGERIFG